MEWTKITMAILAIGSFIFTIFKTYRELGLKREISDLEQLMKFIAYEQQDNFKKQPDYIKDSFCQTVSFLKGHTFKEIEPLLNKPDIPLIDLQNLLRLKKMGVITWDKEKTRLSTSNQYKPKKTITKYKLQLNPSTDTSIIFNWFTLILFTAPLVQLIYKTTENNIITLIISIVLIATIEVPMLLRIDKIKATQDFEKNGLKAYLATPLMKKT